MTNLTTQVTVPALRRLMRQTEQTKDMNVLEHGIQVARYFDDLHQHITQQKPLRYEWRLPEWIYEPVLHQYLLPIDVLRRYHTYHDIGKIYCRTVDSEGNVHFPDHAKKSEEIWLRVTGESTVASLMGMDMDIHLLKGNEVDAFCERKEAASLLLTGLAECSANASMFGGISSTSFKIKFKHINRRGNAIVKKLKLKSELS
jgi:hypothetical protein